MESQQIRAYMLWRIDVRGSKLHACICVFVLILNGPEKLKGSISFFRIIIMEKGDCDDDWLPNPSSMVD